MDFLSFIMAVVLLVAIWLEQNVKTVATIDFERTELTWEGSEEDFRQSLGSFRPKRQLPFKESFVSVDSWTFPELKQVNQIYKKLDSQMQGFEEIIEIVWVRVED